MAAVLCQQLHETRPDNPFEPVRVVVGSRGVARWLRHRLAEHLGICANVRFPFPAATLDSLVDAVAGRGPELDPWSPDALAWSVVDALREHAEAPELAWFRPYLADEGVVTPREWGIARQVADVFDRYITYRPRVAVNWSQGNRVEDLPTDLAWQPIVWAELARKLQTPHRAERLLTARQAMVHGTAPSSWSTLRLFGVSSLPPAWMELLGAAAQHIDITLFLLAPSDEYWGDMRRHARGDVQWRDLDPDQLDLELSQKVRLHNPLLASLGRQAREFQVILESLEGQQGPDGQTRPYADLDLALFANPERVESLGGYSAPATPNTVLHALQADMVAANQRVRDLPPPHDRSIAFHACHGPTRQVEVLRDQLLHLFDAHPDLHPRDVVVMTPDIATFAPLISAVFDQGRPYRADDGWGAVGSPQIPYEIADLTARETNPVAEALLRIVDLASGRVRASEVLDLLSLAPVRDRFGLAADDMPQVAQWVSDSGIRWGLDAEHRTTHGLPEDAQNTWDFGIDRLLLGVCLPDDRDDRFAAIAPFDHVEGASALVVGRLVHALRTLAAVLRSLNEPRPATAWVAALSHAASELTHVTEDDAWLTVAVNDALASLAEDVAHTHGGAVTLGVIKAVVGERFARVVGHAKEHSGAVTFCAMAPMRSVPYRVVCLLGLDDGALPRTHQPVGFDWIDRAPRPGDRTARDEDRYLFLEALLAAREHVLLFWSGQDLRTNEERPAATPLVELMAVIDQTFPVPTGEPAVSKRLTTRHPLQAYSVANFSVPTPASYDKSMLAGARATTAPPSPPDPFFSTQQAASDAQDAVTLDALIRFFENPSAWLLRNRLAVDLTDRDATIPDREPVELRGLERWSIWNAVVQARLHGARTDDLHERLASSGGIPLGYAGVRVTQTWSQAVDDALVALDLLDSDGTVRPADPPTVVDLTLNGTPLTGSLTQCWGDRLIHIHFGAERGKRWIRPWVELLAWTAMGGTPRAVVAWKNAALLGLDTPSKAAEHLGQLVDLYRTGCQVPVPFFPDTSLEFVKKLGKRDPSDERAIASAVQGARTKWSGYYGGDGEDPHTAKLYDGRYGALDAHGQVRPVFVQAAQAVFAPLVQVRTTARDVAKWESP